MKNEHLNIAFDFLMISVHQNIIKMHKKQQLFAIYRKVYNKKKCIFPLELYLLEFTHSHNFLFLLFH